jgi:hypothetical protein
MGQSVELDKVYPSHNESIQPIDSSVTVDAVVKIDSSIDSTIAPDNMKSYDAFLKKLAWRESRGNWTIINRFGYMGKYQIGKLALKDIGMDSITVEAFRADSTVFPEELQDIAVRKLIKNNRRYLRDCIDCYENTIINGILITESSILGAAHLVGASQVKEWLNCDGGITKVDGNGTTIESYLKLFSGYQVV